MITDEDVVVGWVAFCFLIGGIFFLFLDPSHDYLGISVIFIFIGLILLIFLLKDFFKPDTELKKVVSLINDFVPAKKWPNEDGYHKNLLGYLQVYYPETESEPTEGSSRPDLIINNIAIEIKGPTDNQGLITIADKINRYSQHFEHIIIVLFEVQTLERFYQEWYEGIMRQYRDLVTIIRK